MIIIHYLSSTIVARTTDIRASMIIKICLGFLVFPLQFYNYYRQYEEEGTTIRFYNRNKDKKEAEREILKTRGRGRNNYKIHSRNKDKKEAEGEIIKTRGRERDNYKFL